MVPPFLEFSSAPWDAVAFFWGDVSAGIFGLEHPPSKKNPAKAVRRRQAGALD
jgi:hypothetical protein